MPFGLRVGPALGGYLMIVTAAARSFLGTLNRKSGRLDSKKFGLWDATVKMDLQSFGIALFFGLASCLSFISTVNAGGKFEYNVGDVASEIGKNIREDELEKLLRRALTPDPNMIKKINGNISFREAKIQTWPSGHSVKVKFMNFAQGRLGNLADRSTMEYIHYMNKTTGLQLELSEKDEGKNQILMLFTDLSSFRLYVDNQEKNLAEKKIDGLSAVHNALASTLQLRQTTRISELRHCSFSLNERSEIVSFAMYIYVGVNEEERFLARYSYNLFACSIAAFLGSAPGENQPTLHLLLEAAYHPRAYTDYTVDAAIESAKAIWRAVVSR